MKRLNVGSGFNPLPGFENCDINPDCKDLDFVCPLTEIPKEDNTYSEVWSIHSLEHVPMPVAQQALEEWHRILAPGGMAHIDTPNLLRNVRLYLDGDWMSDFNSLTPSEREFCSLDGVPNKTKWVNFKMFSSHHKWDVHFANYDPELLQEMCKRAGFARTEVYQTEPSLIIRAYK